MSSYGGRVVVRLCSMTSLFFLFFVLLFELLRLLLRVDLSDRDAGGLPLLDGLAGAGQLDTDQDPAVPHVPRQEGLGERWGHYRTVRHV